MALLQKIANSSFGKQTGGAMMAFGLLTMPFAAANADNTTSAKTDYITDCQYAICAPFEASKWSAQNPTGVAISIMMGTKSVVTDEQIKNVLTRGFGKHGVNNIKFFFEQNDVPATGLSFHVRGGTEGSYGISGDIAQIVKSIATRANNTNPALARNTYN